MKYLFTIMFIGIISSAYSQHLIGGDIEIRDTTNLPPSSNKVCKVNLYYTEEDSIKDSINIHSNLFSFYFPKISQEELVNNVYKATYEGVIIINSQGGIVRFTDTINSSTIANLSTTNYALTLSTMAISDNIQYDYSHLEQTPIFDFPLTNININGNTASLSFESSIYAADSVEYLTESYWYGGNEIPLPIGFQFDKSTATLSWDTTMTGKYLINIGVVQKHLYLPTTATYRTIIIDTDMDNSLYIPVSTQPIQQIKFNLSIFPNPTSETLQITTDSPVDEIQIYNSIGQQVWQGQGFRDNQVRVNVRDFSDGMYIVRVRQGESWVIEQVLIQ